MEKNFFLSLKMMDNLEKKLYYESNKAEAGAWNR